jgi:ABC-2 type transport system permease protein
MGRTFRGVVAFELRYYLERISTWVYFGIFFALAFIGVCAYGGAWENFDLGNSRVVVNSPFRITALIGLFSILMVPVTAAMAGNAVYRDFEAGIHPLVFTSSIRKRTYLGGRYVGAVLANLVVALAVPLGALAASLMPFMPHERVGPFRPEAYAQALLFFTLPNLVLTGAVFLSLAALTRRMLPNYTGGILLLLAYSLSAKFINDLDREWLGGMLDAFGLSAVGRATRYWTLWEQNHALLPPEPLLLWNRALWMGLGLAILEVTVRAFPFAQLATERGARRSVADEPAPAQRAAVVVPHVRLSTSAGTRLRQYAALARRAFRDVVANVYFPVIVGACLTFLAVSATRIGSAWGTNTYPVTYQVLDLVTGTLSLFVLIIITFYAGELVWHERELRVSQIVDALPLPGWIAYAARLTALAGVLVTLLAVGMVSGMAIQLLHGYTRLEPAHYLTELFGIQLAFYLELAVVALLVHVAVNHKYLGHFVLVLYYFSLPFLPQLGLSHNLLQLGQAPEVKYSDMNGYGHALGPWAWFTLYWGAFAVLLALASNLLWVRGQESEAGWRLRIARLRTRRPIVVGAGAAAALMLATGGWILYNTNVRNEYRTEREETDLQVRYEKRYKRFQNVPQPRVTAVKLDMELYPETRRFRVLGTYGLRNRTDVAIDSVHVDLPADLTVHGISFSRAARRVIGDRDGGYYVFALARPLGPGDSLQMRFDVAKETRGFTNQTEFGPVLGNGTFFTSELLPHIGYNAASEVDDEDVRARHGLPRRPRVASIDDPRGRMRNTVSADADWVDFEATVGTSAGQVAVAPGYLDRTWARGGRRWFHYRMDAPMLNFYAFLSARYAVRRDRWKGVAIEVYHQPGHEYNLDRMVRGVKRALSYYTAQFGPYQHRQVRILEFPRYAAYAQSFANTIPYSESIGFIAQVDDDDIDYPFFVTAHEVAHQWWGHQLVGADVQGAEVLSETLAEYSALMVMEKEYGQVKMERFLRYELDEYLRGRGSEREREMPLALAEHQAYIHYNKGGMVMYALRDLVGEQRVNLALRSLLAEQRFRGPPYPTTRDLVRHLRAVTPDSMQHVITDMFERITLFENRAVEATSTPLGRGRWHVEVVVEARKVRADTLGNETYVPVDDWIDVGLYRQGGSRGSTLELRREHLTARRTRVSFDVSSRPLRAGIDPTHKLIDRRGSDNVIAVTERAAAKASAPAPRKR